MTATEPEGAARDSVTGSLWLAWLGGPVTFALASHTYELWDDGGVSEPTLAVTWVVTLIGHVASGPVVTALLRSGDGMHEPRRLCLGMHWITLGVLGLVTIMQVPRLHLVLRDIIAWNAVAFAVLSVILGVIEAQREDTQRE